MREVGFQRIETFADFKETHTADDPDFYIHVAEKSYLRDEELAAMYSTAVNTARDYYNSDDADNFYATIWGGEDIHIGTYTTPDESIGAASHRTVERLAGVIEPTAGSKVLDLGSGYGGAARHLAKTSGCHVTCLNLSEVENERNRTLTDAQGLRKLIDVIDGSFEDLPFEDNAYDIVWSQDAFLHSGDRLRVLEEIARVLRPGGHFVFTDPMATEGCPPEVRQPILQRLQLETLGTPDFYVRELNRLGFTDVTFDDDAGQLATHYQRVLDETERRGADLDGMVSPEYLEKMKTGLRHWVRGGQSGHLAWGVFHARAR
jgi:sarcosine/dimethylglycine N-methyltransferase